MPRLSRSCHGIGHGPSADGVKHHYGLNAAALPHPVTGLGDRAGRSPGLRVIAPPAFPDGPFGPVQWHSRLRSPPTVAGAAVDLALEGAEPRSLLSSDGEPANEPACGLAVVRGGGPSSSSVDDWTAPENVMPNTGQRPTAGGRSDSHAARFIPPPHPTVVRMTDVAIAPAHGAVGRCPAALRALIPGGGLVTEEYIQTVINFGPEIHAPFLARRTNRGLGGAYQSLCCR